MWIAILLLLSILVVKFNKQITNWANDNIEKLLYTRFVSKKIRMAGGRTKGPSKRKNSQNQEFSRAFRNLLEAERS